MDKDLITDYRKWLLYSFDNQNFDNYYNLFKALEAGGTYENINIVISDGMYVISMDVVGESLQVTEEQRRAFLKYLTDNYFQTSEVDDLKAGKTQQAEINNNHKLISPKSAIGTDEASEYQIRPHPKETTYFNIKLIVSLFIYLTFAVMIFYSAMENLPLLITLLTVFPILLVLVLLNKILKGLFIGLLKGNSIRITKDQYPDVFKIVEGQARRMKVELPDVYVMSGHFNAFVTMFSRAHILMIYSEVLETALRGDYDVLKYVVAHELCHIKQRHLSKEKYLFPSKIIPFLGLAYSRGCEYTCDRAGYNFSPKGTVQGILIMTTGKEIHSKFNIEMHIQNSIADEGFWTWFSEKFLTHPHLYKRLVEIKKFSQYS